jgi:hypothetical protein
MTAYLFGLLMIDRKSDLPATMKAKGTIGPYSSLIVFSISVLSEQKRLPAKSLVMLMLI